MVKFSQRVWYDSLVSFRITCMSAWTKWSWKINQTKIIIILLQIYFQFSLVNSENTDQIFVNILIIQPFNDIIFTFFPGGVGVGGGGLLANDAYDKTYINYILYSDIRETWSHVKISMFNSNLGNYLNYKFLILEFRNVWWLRKRAR